MSTEHETYWQIHHYLKGDLQGDELLSFRTKLSTDRTLQEAVNRHEMANRLILQNKLQAVAKLSLETKQSYQYDLKWKRQAISAAAILVVATTAFFYFTQKVVVEKEITVAVAERPVIATAGTPVVQKTSSVKNEKVWKSASTAPVSSASGSENVTITREVISAPSTSVSAPVILADEVTEKVALPVPLPLQKEVRNPETTCAGVKLNASVTVTPACIGKSDGAIHVAHFQGGTAPYYYEIRSSEGKIFSSAAGLNSGTYAVQLHDKFNCLSEINEVKIKEIPCNTAEEEKVFNPFLNETFEIPASEKPGTFFVYKKDGSLYYKEELFPGNLTQWNGMSLQGQLEAGFYTYQVLYPDGTSKQGTFTIAR